MLLSSLQDLPTILARRQGRKWLIVRGATANALSPAALDRLIAMACDRATAPRQQFPGAIFIRRRGDVLFVD